MFARTLAKLAPKIKPGTVLHKGGIKRRASSFNTQRIDHVYEDPHVDNAETIRR